MYTTTAKFTCLDCRQEVVLSASEQRFYADRPSSEPRRCISCRAPRRRQQGSRVHRVSVSLVRGHEGAHASRSTID
jgi:hypothetical protein